VTVFTTGIISGAPTVGINGNLILQGTITASMLNVATLTAISAHFGNATVDGALTSGNGKMLQDFTNGRIVISDNS
jgi:hypothetical protein